MDLNIQQTHNVCEQISKTLFLFNKRTKARQEMFKKVRSARPQALCRAERTGEYVSTTKGRERR